MDERYVETENYHKMMALEQQQTYHNFNNLHLDNFEVDGSENQLFVRQGAAEDLISSNFEARVMAARAKNGGKFMVSGIEEHSCMKKSIADNGIKGCPTGGVKLSRNL